jgi:hypothetical protein
MSDGPGGEGGLGHTAPGDHLVHLVGSSADTRLVTATSIMSRSGTPVVSFCSHIPGAAMNPHPVALAGSPANLSTSYDRPAISGMPMTRLAPAAANPVCRRS